VRNGGREEERKIEKSNAGEVGYDISTTAPAPVLADDPPYAPRMPIAAAGQRITASMSNARRFRTAYRINGAPGQRVPEVLTIFRAGRPTVLVHGRMAG
jgi:hypothetical protein